MIVAPNAGSPISRVSKVQVLWHVAACGGGHRKQARACGQP